MLDDGCYSWSMSQAGKEQSAKACSHIRPGAAAESSNGKFLSNQKAEANSESKKRFVAVCVCHLLSGLTAERSKANKSRNRQAANWR
jgi:hypothetical protein